MRMTYRRTTKILLTVALTLLLGLAGIVIVGNLRRTNHQAVNQLIDDANSALREDEFALAAKLAREAIRLDNTRSEPYLVLAHSYSAQGDASQALETLERMPTAPASVACEVHVLEGDIAFYQLLQPSAAADSYRAAIETLPNSRSAIRQFSLLLSLTGQWWAATPYQLQIIADNDHQLADLIAIALGDATHANVDFAETLGSASSLDPINQFVAARIASADGNPSRCDRLLGDVTVSYPEFVAAHSLRGQLILDGQSSASLTEWQRRLPDLASEHPSVWAIHAMALLRTDRESQALRCFVETLRRDPNHLEALAQAASLLRSQGNPSLADRLARRSELLLEYQNTVRALMASESPVHVLRAIELAESLGNDWEALGWARYLKQQASPPQSLTATLERLNAKVADLEFVRTRQEFNPVRDILQDRSPLPDLTEPPPNVSTRLATDEAFPDPQLVNQASELGIHFLYFNAGRDISQGTEFMYEVLGGGVAIIDYDLDLDPDLYFAQGCPWPPGSSDELFTDQLFRNTGSKGFHDTTQAAQAVDQEFSQGATVGDFDSDGFPDLFVANIGRNRLLRNNGDGTFSEVHSIQLQSRDTWSTSCAIVDLNGDSHPDIYIVNYLQGDDVFTRRCGSRMNHVCLPQLFEAADDTVLINQGNGQFIDLKRSASFPSTNGKGLGILVGPICDSSSMNIFVANDTVANHFYRVAPANATGDVNFQDEAVLRGIAMNAQGRTEACMGVAAADVDGDSLLDIFVTNFAGESNTLYRQSGEGDFRDQTRTSGLRESSLNTLGFGTQFVDANLDGALDLFTANGHIDDYSDDGHTDYRMRPSLYMNDGTGQYSLYDPVPHSAYLQKPCLGRAVARVDWNRDGREDLVVQHLDEPAALLTNTTSSDGQWVSIHCRGTISSRDAIGVQVTLITEQRRIVRRLLAGDGFHASNERTISIRLTADDSPKQLLIDWPSGLSQTWRNIALNRQLLAIEGKPRLYPLE